MYIHYRLDEDRVVCSKETVLRFDSKRKLYDISSLCKEDIDQDISDSNKNWDEAIAKLNELKKYKENKKNKNKNTITQTISDVFTTVKTKIGSFITKNVEKIQKKISKFKEKQDKINRLKKEVDKYKNSARKWEDGCKALKKDNIKLQAEIEELKKLSI